MATRHVSLTEMARVFAGEAPGWEAETAIAHIAACRRCRCRAEKAATAARQRNHSPENPTAAGALLALLDSEKETTKARLLARSRWAELEFRTAEDQIASLGNCSPAHAREIFELILRDATEAALEDPFLGEERARLAHSLAAALSGKAGLQGRAMLVIVNCRRLAAAWKSSAEALRVARQHFDEEGFEPRHEALYYQAKASLASETGQLELARECLAQAAANYRKAGDQPAVASITVQEANTLLAGGLYEEALEKAGAAVRRLPHGEVRLELLARSLIAECLALLGRPAEALRCFLVVLPLYKEFGDHRSELRLINLEAILFDSLGYIREAEKAYRRVAAAYMEAELYKDAFRTMLSLFTALAKRNEWEKAAQVCEDVLRMYDQTAETCHDEIKRLWHDLLALAGTRHLSEDQLLAARTHHVRHWHAPAKQPLFLRAAGSAGVKAEQGEFGSWPPSLPGTTVEELLEVAREPRGFISVPAVGGYADAMQAFDRRLLETAFVQCGGCYHAMARLLAISRNTVKDKLGRYGIAEALQDTAMASCGLNLLGEPEKEALELLRARSLWADLVRLPARRQLERARSGLRNLTPLVVELALGAASATALEDPELGEEKAIIAHSLAEALPKHGRVALTRADLMSEAMFVIGNCRRLTGDWSSAEAAFKTAEMQLQAGTRDALRTARLYSLRASLASDTGKLEVALAFLDLASAAQARGSSEADRSALAVQEANILLFAGRHEAALARAEEALDTLPPRAVYLEMLARSIVTECLAILGRADEALRNLSETWPLFEQLRGQRSSLRLAHLEAFVLEAYGFERESEAALQACLASYAKAGLYKDVFLGMLSRLALLGQRGAWRSAAEVCEFAIGVTQDADQISHDCALAVWADLLAMVRVKEVPGARILEAQHTLVRACSVACGGRRDYSGGQPPLRWEPAGGPFPTKPAGSARGMNCTEVDSLFTVELPSLPESLSPGEYQTALDWLDRRLIAEGLQRSGGQVKPAARLLGLAAKTIRRKMTKYGLNRGVGRVSPRRGRPSQRFESSVRPPESNGETT